MAKSSDISTFDGFSDEAFEFLKGLQKDNSKAYFDKHRGDYDAHIVAPARAFVVALGEQLQQRISLAIVAVPKGNGSIGRINRDVRFSKDKSPYNTHLQFRFWEGANKNTSSGFALRMSPDGVGFAAGIMAFDKAALARYRDAVIAETSGKALVAAFAKAKKAKATRGEPHYKKVPKGFDPEHPRADLLRHTGCGVMLKVALPKLAGSAKFASWAADRFEKISPVQRWLAEYVC